MTNTLTSITTLSIVLFSLISYNFIGAQWTNAPSSPPANNAAAPINVSATNQVKAGGLGAGRFIANWDMRSPFYCDENGENCFEPASVGGAPSCSLDLVYPSACLYSASPMYNSVTCPSGYAPIGGALRGQSCSSNQDTYTRTCARIVCSQ